MVALIYPLLKFYACVLQLEYATPVVTSTSTGKIKNLLGALNLFVRIRMNAVWLLATFPRKFIRMIPFVSYGAICCKIRKV